LVVPFMFSPRAKIGNPIARMAGPSLTQPSMTMPTTPLATQAVARMSPKGPDSAKPL
jgi:hypothetical protein